MDERFIAWLQQVTPKKSSWTTRLSDLRRVEAAYGDLDAAYDSDEMQSLFDELTYTADDERNRRKPTCRIPFNGDARTNIATFRSAAMKYLRFRQELEEESGKAAFSAPSIEESVEIETERTFTLERDLQEALRKSITQLEVGLEVADGGIEYSVPSGRIDILAKDAEGASVVIELKAVRAPRDAVAQVLAYMGDIQSSTEKAVRGILVAPDFDPRAVSAARMVPSLKLVEYKFSFSFSQKS